MPPTIVSLDGSARWAAATPGTERGRPAPEALDLLLRAALQAEPLEGGDLRELAALESDTADAELAPDVLDVPFGIAERAPGRRREGDGARLAERGTPRRFRRAARCFGLRGESVALRT